MRHQVTIKDIAKQLDVSVATVSRALRDLPDIHPDTKKLVLDLAQELDYQPNVLATSLVKSKTKTLGLIVPDLGYYFFSTVVKAIEDAAIAAGYSLLIAQTQESFERELTNIQNLSRSQVEGIIISLSRETVNFDHLTRLQRKGIARTDSSIIAQIHSRIGVNAHIYRIRHYTTLCHRYIVYSKVIAKGSQIGIINAYNRIRCRATEPSIGEVGPYAHCRRVGGAYAGTIYLNVQTRRRRYI